jgi:hypothetical protein
VRLRLYGWKIFRLDAEMTLHDAQMSRLSQWWKRARRAGHAYAEGSWLHGAADERHWVKETRSIWLWGLFIPLLALGLAWPSHGLSLLLLLGYPLQIFRTFLKMRRKNLSNKNAAFYALSCTVGKFAQVGGAMEFSRNRLLGNKSTLIEYK